MEDSPLNHSNKFLTTLETVAAIEGKIRLCLERIQGLLSGEDSSYVQGIWEVKRHLLDLFKEKLPPRVRARYWGEYVELSSQMRHAQKSLDRESAFATQQIELAIEGLKQDLSRFDSLAEEIDPVAVPDQAFCLKEGRAFYVEKQRRLSLLSVFAGRFNALRREVVHTPMKVKSKHCLLEALKLLGDEIFPRRREAIHALSERFAQDVAPFQPDKSKIAQSKEEIKALQAFAKTLSIDTQTFTRVRERLSGFWDEIKEWEKQRRQALSKQREESKEILDTAIAPKIALLKQQCLEEKVTLEQAREQCALIEKEMNELALGREATRRLQKDLSQALIPLQQKREQARKRQEEEEKLREKEQQEAQKSLFARMDALANHAESLPLDSLVEKWEALVKEEKALSLTGSDRERLVQGLDALFDHIQEKRWQLLKEDFSEEGKHQLHALLDDRHRARRKLKETLEVQRKTLGKSDLGVETSLFYQEMIAEEKMRLDAIETVIEELEERLFEVEE